MLKHLRQSTWLRCLVVLAFVFFVLPLSPNDAYALEDEEYTVAIVALVLAAIFVPIWITNATHDADNNGSTDKSTEKDDKEKVLAERFAKLNTDKSNGLSPKGRVTYPVFEW